MSTRYTRQSLSDRLAEIGRELGRAPQPEDLKGKGAPRYATYLKYFDDNWELALEYAGYPKECVDEPEEVEGQSKPAEPQVEQTAEEQQDIAEAPPEPTATYNAWSTRNIKLINLYGKDVTIFGSRGPVVLKSIGRAYVSNKQRTHARAEFLLRNIIGGAEVYVSDEPQGIAVIDEDGNARPFPDPRPGVYLLVSGITARAAKSLGRNTNDLIYPGRIEYVGAKPNGKPIVRSLEMLASNTLWRL